MFTMRPEHMEIFAQRQQERFINELTENVAISFPEIAWNLEWINGPERLQSLLIKYLEEGKSFGLSYDYTLSRYCNYRLEFGDELITDHDWEWMREILNYKTVPEEEKIGQIDTILYGGPIYPEAWNYE
jgi:hypothetical protein